MSYNDYEQSKQISFEGYSFYACLMAAMRAAGSEELKLLKAAFPDTYKELKSRRDSRGGILPTDGSDAQLILMDDD